MVEGGARFPASFPTFFFSVSSRPEIVDVRKYISGEEAVGAYFADPRQRRVVMRHTRKIKANSMPTEDVRRVILVAQNKFLRDTATLNAHVR